jgi:hypothetical protein
MRESRPPVRFSDPVHVVLARRNIVLVPFEGQPRKYAIPRRLPALAVKISGVRRAGYGLFLREKVKAGQSITLYRRKIISEATAKKLKDKAYFCQYHFVIYIFNDLFLGQGNRHIRANHAACCCLNSKPDSSQDVELMCKLHEVAGMANSSLRSNTEFVDVGYDTILQATVDMKEGTELFVKYDH